MPPIVPFFIVIEFWACVMFCCYFTNLSRFLMSSGLSWAWSVGFPAKFLSSIWKELKF